MSEQKKYGTFAGVFTPSILTILGVIMYLRMGWVVGHAGLWGVLAIIAIAHIISVTTGLSVSSIATDKKVGAGGVYYVLSRSLGLPIGGALGMTLFVATAFSIALYMVGFAEIFNSVFDFNLVERGSNFYVDDSGSLFHGWSKTNLIRLTGSVGLFILAVIALISTSIALKSQFIILALIVLSLFSIFLGTPGKASVVELGSAKDVTVPFIAIFAVFFPAVTGFTAGIAMSGDLKDSKKSIPVGTLAAIAVGLLVYTILGLYLYYNFNADTLKMNGNVMFESAYISHYLVNFGVWGATLSSALGGILGGPRILQAMSVDKITPKIFAKGVGKNNEPQNAQKFEHKPVQIVTQRHNHHHRNSSNYNNQYHHKNQHNVKLKTHRKQVGSFIEINTSHIPLLSIIVSKNKIINPQHHSVKHQKNRHKRQKLNQHKIKQHSHYGAVNYLAFDPHR